MKGEGAPKLTLPLFAVRLLGLVVIVGFLVAATPTPSAAGEASAQRLIFASAGFHDSNRFWTVARLDHLQYDPFWETLLSFGLQ